MTEGYVVGGDRLAAVVRGFLAVEENGFRRCDVPARPLQAQIRLLLERRVRQGVVFACCSAPWARVTANGWTVYDCRSADGPLMDGCVRLPRSVLGWTVDRFVRQWWGRSETDPWSDASVELGVLLSDAPLGALGRVLLVTSGSGGVGKSVSARRLAWRAGQVLPHVLLVDGNARQPSQSSFFNPLDKRRFKTVSEWRPGLNPVSSAVTLGRDLHGLPFDVAFAPPRGAAPSDDVLWQGYAGFLLAARVLYDLIVVDLDHVLYQDLGDGLTAGGGLLVPLLQGGDMVLFIVKAGAQTQLDGLRTLTGLAESGVKRGSVLIKTTVPLGLESWKPFDMGRFGLFMGVEKQDARGEAHIAARDVGWPAPGLDFVRERVLLTVFPHSGFDPALAVEPEADKKRGLKWWRR